MHPEEIKAALRLKGYSLGKLRMEFDDFYGHKVSHAINHHEELLAIQRRTAEIIGLPLEAVFPTTTHKRKSPIERALNRANAILNTHWGLAK